MTGNRPSKVQREIRQSRPFASLPAEGAVALLRTADVLRHRLASVLEPHGITPQQYNVLRILRGTGEEGLPTLEIVERMVERAPGITRLLDRLERKKLVRRDRIASDRRLVLCRITDAGLALLTRLDKPVEETNKALFGGLAEPDVQQLLGLLDSIRAGLPPDHTASTNPAKAKHPSAGTTDRKKETR